MATKPSRRSLRGRVLAAALIPSVALLLVGVVLSGYLIYDAAKGRDFVVRVHDAAQPGVEFFGAIREERRLTLEAVAGSRVADELAQQRAETDAATRGLMSHVDGMVDGASEQIRNDIRQLRELLESLTLFRQQVDNGANTPGGGPDLQEAYDLYNRIIDTVASGLTGVARLTPDAETSYLRVTSMPLFNAADGMARADALAAAAHVSGGLSDEEFETYAGEVGAYRSQLARASMIPSVREKYEQLRASDAWRVVGRVEDSFLGGGSQQVPVPPDRWHAAASEVGGTLMSLYIEQSTNATDEGVARADRTLTGAIIAGVVALVVGLVLIFFAWRLASWLVRRLVRLREETLDLADHRLPELVARVRKGENVDVVDLESSDHGQDEIGQVADAFAKAQRTAVAAAIEESRVREGTRTVFLNIAHRSQVLVHRQLKALDDAERGLDDPKQLEMLFRLDHLATRSRRNAENLIILGGEQPGRRWRNPVSVADLVRGATAEIEHYRRIDIAGLPDVAVIGPAVGDIVHLLAELFDNATSFSPPDSRVLVRGEAAEGRGVILEIEDQGLGIEEEDAERLNTLLAEPPDFSFMALSDEPRLGLFVVARLAARHGIQVRLREAIHGGTRAVVRLGPELLGTGSGYLPAVAPPAQGTGEQPAVPASHVSGSDDVGWPTAEPADPEPTDPEPTDPEASAGAAEPADPAKSAGPADSAWPTESAGESVPGQAPTARAGAESSERSPVERERRPSPSPRDTSPGTRRRAASVSEALSDAEGETETASASPGPGGWFGTARTAQPDQGSPEALPRRRPRAPEQSGADRSGGGGSPARGESARGELARGELARGKSARGERGAGERASDETRTGAERGRDSRRERPVPAPRPGRTPQPESPPRPRRPAQPPASTQAQTQAAQPGQSGQVSAAGGQGRPPLPRRRKQENLAPQLRQAPPETPEPAPGGIADGRELDAEAARSRFAGFQRGTQRARQDQGNREGRDGNGFVAGGEGPR